MPGDKLHVVQKWEPHETRRRTKHRGPKDESNRGEPERHTATTSRIGTKPTALTDCAGWSDSAWNVGTEARGGSIDPLGRPCPLV